MNPKHVWMVKALVPFFRACSLLKGFFTENVVFVTHALSVKLVYEWLKILLVLSEEPL